MRLFSAVLLCFATPLAAQEQWQPLSGVEITEILLDTTWDFGDAWQAFFASGRTNYNAGRDSWGYWETRGDSYCSQWPPADGWACYKVDRAPLDAGVKIRFVGESGDETIGILRQ